MDALLFLWGIASFAIGLMFYVARKLRNAKRSTLPTEAEYAGPKLVPHIPYRRAVIELPDDTKQLGPCDCEWCTNDGPRDCDTPEDEHNIVRGTE